MKGTFEETETQEGVVKGIHHGEADFELALKTNEKTKKKPFLMTLE